MEIASSYAQICLLGFCHFCSIGMWNALNGIGSLGTDDPDLAHYCNSMMYLAGILGGLVGGVMVNILGVKWSTVLGLVSQASTLAAYCLYYFFLRAPLTLALVVCFNALTSLGISCFTSAVGAALCYYPLPEERSKFIATSSAILNLGGLAGGALAAVMNFAYTTQQPALSLPSYLAIILVSVFGVFVAILLIKPQNQVMKSDGSAPSIEHQKVLTELRHIPSQLRNRFLYLLMPLFLVNVWHEVVLFNYFNGGLFNIRSRAVNSCCYYVARMLAGFIFQVVCERARPTLRGRVHAIVVLITSLLVLGAASSLYVFYFFVQDEVLLDFAGGGSTNVVIATFLIYGSLETISSNFTYWLLAELDIGDDQTRNRIIGLSRSFVNLGGCLSWSLDILAVSPFMQWCVNLLVWAASVTGALLAAAINGEDQRIFERPSELATDKSNRQLIRKTLSAEQQQLTKSQFPTIDSVIEI